METTDSPVSVDLGTETVIVPQESSKYSHDHLDCNLCERQPYKTGEVVRSLSESVDFQVIRVGMSLEARSTAIQLFTNPASTTTVLLATSNAVR